MIAAYTVGGVMMALCFGYATCLTGCVSGLYLFVANALLIVIAHRSATHPREAAFIAVVAVIVMINLFILFPEPSGRLHVGDWFNSWVFVLSLLSIFGMVGQVLFALNAQVHKTETALAAEYARSEALLRNLLPDEIAQRLKAQPGLIHRPWVAFGDASVRGHR